MKKVGVTYILLLLFFNGIAQIPNQEKAQIIFSLAQEITWQDDENIQAYNITVFDNEELYNAFLDYKNAGRRLKGKYFDVIDAKNIDDIIRAVNFQNTKILYVSPKKTKLLDTIYKICDGADVLLISDLADSLTYSVVNLTDNEDKIYEINYKNALKAHLKLTENILILGADEELLRKMYIDSMRVFRQERQEALYKLYQIEDQQKRLQLSEEQITLKERELDSIKRVVAQMAEQVKAQKALLAYNKQILAQQKQKIDEQKTIYEQQKQHIDSINNLLTQKAQEIAEKEKQIQNIDKQLTESLKKIETQADFIKLGIVIFVILLFMFYAYYMSRKKRKEIEKRNKEIEKKNEEITQINEELKRQQELIEEKNALLEQHNREITDSIHYAEKIQDAMLPSLELFETNFDDYFLLFKPRDIVSGDFYWFKRINDKIVIAVGDCTGHGVPGAFMSVLSTSLLNEIVEKNILQPNIILEVLRDKIIKSLSKKNEVSQDGLDIALAVIDLDKKTIDFAGAYNPLVHFSKNNNYKLTELKADKMPVGQYFGEKKHFNKKQIKYEKGDTIYLFTDGYKDQFGGKPLRKLSKKEFYKLLQSMQGKPMAQQKTELDEFFQNWIKQGNYEQIDDVLVLGIKL